MITTRAGRGTRGRLAALVAAVALLASGGTPQVAQGQVLCRITSADAFFFADAPRGDIVSYYAHVIMYTEDCGLSPAEVQATFRTIAPDGVSTCNFKGTLQSEYAMCQGAQGLAAPGSPVVIEAIGRTYGSNGADLFASSCVLVVTSVPPSDGLPLGTSGSRASCPLPIE